MPSKHSRANVVDSRASNQNFYASIFSSYGYHYKNFEVTPKYRTPTIGCFYHRHKNKVGEPLRTCVLTALGTQLT